MTKHIRFTRVAHQCLALFLAISVLAAHADEPAPLVPGSYQILASVTVQRGDHTMTYHRISPPQFPAKVVSQPTAEELAAAAANAGKAHASFAIGATVYDHEVTELRWTTPGSGVQHIAYSNIDFTVFTGMADFEWANTLYDAALAIGNASRAEPV